jgi:hypothetical protein
VNTPSIVTSKVRKLTLASNKRGFLLGLVMPID